MTRTSILDSKEVLISTLEIAEINFLQSIKEVKPDIVSKQFRDNVNHIAWIIGHCVSHMDLYLSVFTNERKLSNEQREYHAYAAPKKKIKKFPFSFPKLIDDYLAISDDFFKKLHTLSEEDFYKIRFPNEEERLIEMMQRITLHFMGHTGQIVLLRRILGDTPWSFVGGVSKKLRNKLRKEWIDWWEENKKNYKV